MRRCMAFHAAGEHLSSGLTTFGKNTVIVTSETRHAIHSYAGEEILSVKSMMIGERLYSARLRGNCRLGEIQPRFN